MTYQDARVTYNARGWKISYIDSGENGQQGAWADYSYAKTGDIRRIQNHAKKLILSAPGESTLWNSDDWFDYDAMERMVVADGELDAVYGVVGGANGKKGTLIEYDAAGQRVRTTALSTNPGISGSVAEDYFYREDGYLMQVNIDNARRANDDRDLLGRINAHHEWATDGATEVYSTYQMAYNKRSDLLSQKTFTRMQTKDQLGNELKSYNTITNYYGVSGKTGAYTGTVTYSESLDTTGGGAKLSKTTNTLEWWDSGRQKTTVIVGPTPTVGNGSTTFTYDANGNLTLANIIGARPHQTQFITDALGQVIKRWETSTLVSNPLQYYYNFDGKQVAEVGNDGVRNTSYDRTIELHRYASSTFRYGGSGASGISFDTAYDRLNSYSGAEAATNASYTTRDGDTLRSIAHTLWGDESLWYVIASANGLSGKETLAGGVRLVVPSTVINAKNNASTYRVYDAAEAMGNLAPAPTTAKGKGCGVGQVLVAIVAIAVTIALIPHFPALAAQFASVVGPTILAPALAAATIAATASVVAQSVGVLTRVQDRIDWRSVAVSALSAGVSGGFGAVSEVGSGFGAGVIRALEVNAITQGLSVATGLQSKFDWVSLATAGLQGGVSNAVANSSWTPKADSNPFSPASLLNTFVPSAASGVAAAGVRSLATGTDFGDNLRAVLPDVIASTIGNAIGRGIQQAAVSRAQRAENADQRLTHGPGATRVVYGDDGKVSVVQIPDDTSIPPGDPGLHFGEGADEEKINDAFDKMKETEDGRNLVQNVRDLKIPVTITTKNGGSSTTATYLTLSGQATLVSVGVNIDLSDDSRSGQLFFKNESNDYDDQVIKTLPATVAHELQLASEIGTGPALILPSVGAEKYNEIDEAISARERRAISAENKIINVPVSNMRRIPILINKDQLSEIMPEATRGNIDRYWAPLNDAMNGKNIVTKPGIAAFLGQIYVESGQLAHSTELMGYRTAADIQRVYKKKLFPTLASAEPYVMRGQKLANYVYGHPGNTLGNVPGTDDGYNYRGRGLIQVTGRNNYTAVGYGENPADVATASGASLASVKWWENNNLVGASTTELDRIDYDRVTHTVNRANLEAQTRWDAYQRGLTALRRVP